MKEIATLIMCLAPAALLGLILAGADLLVRILFRHCKPLRAWAIREIRLIEDWQEDEE